MQPFLSARLEDPATGDRFEIEFGFDEYATLRDEMAVEIVARRYSGLVHEAQEITATLTLDLQRSEVVIAIGGEEIGRISLTADAVADADERDVEGSPAAIGETAWDILVSHLTDENGSPTADAVEKIIEGLPAFDPLLGCLIKGAVSAAVGQTIRCYHELPPSAETPRDKLRLVAQCLGRYGWRMFSRASFRTFRCWLSLGIL